MTTIAERENLMANRDPKYTGFTPRPVEKLTRRKKPRSALDIECKHFLRTAASEFTHGHPILEYKLWMEAGKHENPYPTKPDDNYNSNVWRNFRQHYGFSTTAEQRKIADVIAAMYPLNIPKSSTVGGHTYEKYIRESKMFENQKMQILAQERTRNDVMEFKRLRCRTDARNPPLDKAGEIFVHFQ